MNFKNIFLKGIALSLLTAAVLTGCKKEEKVEDNDTSSANDNSLASFVYDDAQSISDEAFGSGGFAMYKVDPNTLLLSTCATKTIDSLNHADADTITVDFGTANCLCKDGRFRRGKVIITYTGKYRTAGTIINIGFENYYVNDNWVQGTKTITNNGKNAIGNYTHTIVVNGTIVLDNGGGTITWTANKVREWLSGYDTYMLIDDVYSITGTMSGTRKNGNGYSAVVIKPLIRKMTMDCRKHFNSGVLELTPDSKPMRTIDYGDGTCDNIATVTIKGKTYTITLK